MDNINETIFYNILKFLNSRDIRYSLNLVVVNKHLNNFSKNGDFWKELFNKKKQTVDIQLFELLRNRNIILDETTKAILINSYDRSQIPKDKLTKNELEVYYSVCSNMIKDIDRMA